MTERPIIFSAPMIRAILAGRKTQTRRLAWITPKRPRDSVLCDRKDRLDKPSLWQRVEAGDRLWVRENLRVVSDGVEYAADGMVIAETESEWSDRAADFWNHYAHEDGPDLRPTVVPSIFCPRWASRLTLAVTRIRGERLQDISEADAIAEGVDEVSMADVPRQAAWSRKQDFSRLWDKINGPGAWDANPYVVAISFERVP